MYTLDRITDVALVGGGAYPQSGGIFFTDFKFNRLLFGKNKYISIQGVMAYKSHIDSFLILYQETEKYRLFLAMEYINLILISWKDSNS